MKFKVFNSARQTGWWQRFVAWAKEDPSEKPAFIPQMPDLAIARGASIDEANRLVISYVQGIYQLDEKDAARKLTKALTEKPDQAQEVVNSAWRHLQGLSQKPFDIKAVEALFTAPAATEQKPNEYAMDIAGVGKNLADSLKFLRHPDPLNELAEPLAQQVVPASGVIHEETAPLPTEDAEDILELTNVVEAAAPQPAAEPVPQPTAEVTSPPVDLDGWNANDNRQNGACLTPLACGKFSQRVIEEGRSATYMMRLLRKEAAARIAARDLGENGTTVTITKIKGLEGKRMKPMLLPADMVCDFVGLKLLEAQAKGGQPVAEKTTDTTEQTATSLNRDMDFTKSVQPEQPPQAQEPDIAERLVPRRVSVQPAHETPVFTGRLVPRSVPHPEKKKKDMDRGLGLSR